MNRQPQARKRDGKAHKGVQRRGLRSTYLPSIHETLCTLRTTEEGSKERKKKKRCKDAKVPRDLDTLDIVLSAVINMRLFYFSKTHEILSFLLSR